MYSQESLAVMKDSLFQSKKRAMVSQNAKKIEKYFGNENNLFSQEDKLTFEEALQRVRQKTKTFYTGNIINTVRYGNNQSLKHLIGKTVLTHLMIINKQHSVTEIMDTDFWWIERDICIELEADLTEKKYNEKFSKFKKIFNDVFIVDLDIVPENYIEMEQYFKNKLGH